MQTKSAVTIIGAGVIGCAIAYKLSQKGVKDIVVIERNDSITGVNQSLRNGGVVHSGLYYPRDIEPLKATLCVEGCEMLYEFCGKYNLLHKKTGKLILAKNEKEEAYLDFFHKIGQENGVVGIRHITLAQARSMEPNIGEVLSALYIPVTGSAALVPFIEKIKSLSEEKGVQFKLGANVILIQSQNDSFEILIEKNGQRMTHTTEFLINAAGLYADDVAKMVNPESEYVIDPARGELFEYNASVRQDISTNGMHIYAAPFCYDNLTKKTVDLPVDALKRELKAGKITKTLGMHVSPAFDFVDGAYMLKNTNTVGPLKTLRMGKEDYMSNLKTPKDCIEKIHALFPNLREEDVRLRYTGIMAVRRGFTDFTIEPDKKYRNCLNLIGMDSPAWTACLAIGKYVATLL